MEELGEGDVLAGRYVLGPAVGQGAMGEVHLAEDIRLARPVAVKSLRPELARYADVRQRFGQEARAAARISHPNVVRVYDSGEEDGIPFLVMECLPGSTLVDEMAWGLLEPRRARQIGLDVLGALDAAHRLGLVHRDVKPGNILLTAELDGPVKVSDFGIAKSATDGSVTDSGGLVGTASYLAPERVAGGPARPESDLYSLGVVLYECLAGRKPYEAETSLAVALAIHMGGAPSVLELRPDLDPALAELVDRAIAQDPADRWPSAAEMAEALRAFRPRPAREGRSGQVVAPVVAVPAPTEALPADGAGGAGALEPTLLDAAPAATTPLPPVDGDGSGGDRVVDSWGRARSAGVDGAPDDDRTATSRRRRRTALIAGAAAASLLLVVAIAGMGGSSNPEPPAPTTATSAEVVAGPVLSTSTVPVVASVAPPRSVATTRAPRRSVAPAPTARPPATRATTTRPAPTTTRPPPTTAPPPASTPTTPTTAGGITATTPGA